MSRIVILTHRTGLREILGRIDGEITEEQAELEYSDDGETIKRAVLIRTTPKLVMYAEAGEL